MLQGVNTIVPNYCHFVIKQCNIYCRRELKLSTHFSQRPGLTPRLSFFQFCHNMVKCARNGLCFKEMEIQQCLLSVTIGSGG